MKLLIVDDVEQIIRECIDTKERYSDENNFPIQIEACCDVDSAIQKLDSSYDGAIIDLCFGQKQDAGNDILHKIKESFYRLPVVVLTGTPDSVEIDFLKNIEVRKKGAPESGFENIFNYFKDIYITGITDILGGKGIIEETLSKVFQENFLAQKNIWIKYANTDQEKVKRALLRHTLQHLLNILDQENEKYFPLEMFLYPISSNEIKNGKIYRCLDKNYIVMTPACDLVLRENGTRNTDHLILAEIESDEKFSERLEAYIRNHSNGKKNEISKYLRNNVNIYQHWIPQTTFFKGGFVNFRKIKNIHISELNNHFINSEIQISPFFMKDIIYRFSSYYSRQGQPDIDTDIYLNDIPA